MGVRDYVAEIGRQLHLGVARVDVGQALDREVADRHQPRRRLLGEVAHEVRAPIPITDDPDPYRGGGFAALQPPEGGIWAGGGCGRCRRCNQAGRPFEGAARSLRRGRRQVGAQARSGFRFRACTGGRLHQRGRGPTIRAGLPSTKESGGTSCVTIAPAPTIAPSPMVTPQMIVALAPMLARRRTSVGISCQSPTRSSSPFSSTADGYRSLEKQTCGPMNTPSSIVTPVGMKTNASTFTLRPSTTPRWISTNDAILQLSPTLQPYRLTCSGWWTVTFSPSSTSGAITDPMTWPDPGSNAGSDDAAAHT